MINLVNKLTNFKQLKGREKLLFIGLVAAVVFSLYFQLFYKPLARKITRSKFQIKKSRDRLSQLQAKYPQIETQKQNIHSLEKECQSLLAQISEVEKNLPSKRSSSQFLAELTKLAKGVKIVSVRQKTEAGDEYSRIFFELKFNAAYKETINYIRRLESISEFLTIGELDISEIKAKRSESGIGSRLILSTLLSEVSTAEMIKANQDQEDIEISRDIFISSSRPVSRTRKVELKLQGVTYSLEGSTAIINGDVVRLGSKVGDLKVKEINPDEVILTDGIEDHVLLVER